MSLTVAETIETLRGLAPHLATCRPRIPQGAIQQTLNATLTYAIIKIVRLLKETLLSMPCQLWQKAKKMGTEP